MKCLSLAEIIVIMSGRLAKQSDAEANEINLGAMALFQNLTFLQASMCAGFIFATSSQVGKKLGAGSASGAKFQTACGLLCLLTMMTITAVLIVVFRHPIANLFTSDPDLADLLSKLLWLLAAYAILQGFGYSFTATLIGAGRQKDRGIYNIVCRNCRRSL